MAGRATILGYRCAQLSAVGPRVLHTFAPSLFALQAFQGLTAPIQPSFSHQEGIEQLTQASFRGSGGACRCFAAGPREQNDVSEAARRHGEVGTAGDRAAVQPGADKRSPGWTTTLLPTAVQPYAKLMRLDAPIGTWLLLWPGYWCAKSSIEMHL